jgi:hypothetical protein
MLIEKTIEIKAIVDWLKKRLIDKSDSYRMGQWKISKSEIRKAAFQRSANRRALPCSCKTKM